MAIYTVTGTSAAGSGIYALSLCANKKLITDHDVRVFCTDSEQKAREQGLEKALASWPVADGWYSHHVRCMEVVMNEKAPLSSQKRTGKAAVADALKNR